MEVDPLWFDFIRSGRKTVEGRKNSPTWAWINAGVKFLITSGSENVEVICTDVVLWHSIRDYLEGEGLQHTLPGVTTIEEGEEIYLKWYSLEEVKEFGFKAIHIQVLL